MFNLWFRQAFLLIAIAFFAAGCSVVQTAQQIVPAALPSPTTLTAASSVPTTGASPSPTPASASSKPLASDTIQLKVVPGKSEARYRVREQLADVPLPSDAIGRTQAITGTIVGKLDGTIVSQESKFVVDLRTLQSDRSQRDNFLKSSVLQTSQYPNATFVPKSAQGLPLAFPPSGKATFKLIGDLTIRNMTKEVTWDVTCNPGDNQGTCQATTSFKFEYFGLTPPRVPVVLSVQDNITLEVDLSLERVGV